jgi:hypothetical protein
MKYLELFWKIRCWSDGRWMHNESLVPAHFNHFHDLGVCSEKETSEEQYSAMQWVWTPYHDTCGYETEMTVDKFCQQLAGRNIFVVGDSLSWQFWQMIADFTTDGHWDADQIKNLLLYARGLHLL